MFLLLQEDYLKFQVLEKFSYKISSLERKSHKAVSQSFIKEL
jgi:hypothetical protein